MPYNTMLAQPLLAVRIKDGIFVGNCTASQDVDFMLTNKIHRVINCCSSEVPNVQCSAIQHLSFPWKDSQNQVMLDSADRTIGQVVAFIDKALDVGECVLVHSVVGDSRACAVVAAYLMAKFGWTLDNTIAYMNIAHSEMNIKPYFLRQLKIFGRRQEGEYDVYHPLVDEAYFTLDNEQWMLRNTFLNALTSDVQRGNDLYRNATAQVEVVEKKPKPLAQRRRRLTFSDTKQGTSVTSVHSRPVTLGHARGPERFNGGAQQPILARPGTPNRRRLEASDTNEAKGRMLLTLKSRPKASTAGGGGADAGRRSSGAGATPHHHQDPAAMSIEQLTAQYLGTGAAFSRSGAQPQEADASGLTATRAQKPNGDAIAPAAASRTVAAAAPDQTAPRGMDSRANTAPPTRASTGVVSAARPPPDAAEPTQEQRPTVPTQRRAIQSPFLLSSGTQARRGSPLPDQRRNSLGERPSTGGSSPTPAATSSRTPVSRTLGVRTNSPQGRVPTSTSTRASEATRPSSPTARPSSPMGRRDVTTAAAATTPTARGSTNGSGISAARTTTIGSVMRTSSPMSRLSTVGRAPSPQVSPRDSPTRGATRTSTATSGNTSVLRPGSGTNSPTKQRASTASASGGVGRTSTPPRDRLFGSTGSSVGGSAVRRASSPQPNTATTGTAVRRASSPQTQSRDGMGPTQRVLSAGVSGVRRASSPQPASGSTGTSSRTGSRASSPVQRPAWQRSTTTSAASPTPAGRSSVTTTAQRSQNLADYYTAPARRQSPIRK